MSWNHKIPRILHMSYRHRHHEIFLRILLGFFLNSFFLGSGTFPELWNGARTFFSLQRFIKIENHQLFVSARNSGLNIFEKSHLLCFSDEDYILGTKKIYFSRTHKILITWLSFIRVITVNVFQINTSGTKVLSMMSYNLISNYDVIHKNTLDNVM